MVSISSCGLLLGVMGVDRHVPPRKVYKGDGDRSDQERSHQEPDSVDNRADNNGGVDPGRDQTQTA